MCPFNISGLFTDVHALIGSADTTRPVILNSKGPVDMSDGVFKYSSKGTVRTNASNLCKT